MPAPTHSATLPDGRPHPTPPRPLWVFGYGSLMWRPGFPHLEHGPALVHGFHRRLCVTSRHHRGTDAVPGLVMGLDRGGACRGVAYRVPDSAFEETLANLDEREIAHYPIYRRAVVPVRVRVAQDLKTVTALTYIVDRAHADYAGHLRAEEQAAIVRRAVGISGPNPDYIRSTVEHIRALGLRDRHLEAVLRLLDAET